MVAQVLIEAVELLARRGAHHAGHAEVAALAARPHLDGRRIEVGRVPQHHVGDRLGEAGLFAAHDLDGKVAGEGERRAFGHCYADSASRLPARMTLRLNSW